MYLKTIVYISVHVEIEGTLELCELYTVVQDINPNNEPKPVKDDNPSKEDVEFMKKAREVSKRSPDESTKVCPLTRY